MKSSQTRAFLIMNKPEVLELRIATLGEGPHWHEKDQCLFYVDIDNTKVYRYDAKTGENRAVSVGTLAYLNRLRAPVG